jgi:hypothetical protein
MIKFIKLKAKIFASKIIFSLLYQHKVLERIAQVEYQLNAKIQQDIFDLIAKLRPKRPVNFDLIRIGTLGDGGYFLIDDFDKNSDLVFSIGIGEEFSFDEEISKKVKKVIMVDGSIPDFVPTSSNMIMIHKHLGLVKNDFFTSLTNLMSSIQETSYILKLDIEGDEWDILEQMQSFEIIKFKQIIIEFHGLTSFFNVNRLSQFNLVFEKLLASHTVFHIHANNNGSFGLFGDYKLPDVIEVSFALSSIYSFEEIEQVKEEFFVHQNSNANFPINSNWLEIYDK